MGVNSKISWTDHTFNPVIGCTKVSAECRYCYAETLAKRYGWAQWGAGQARYRTSPANWRKPLAWNKQAAAEGVRRRVFCASLADVFDSEVAKEIRDDLFDLIEECTSLDWLLLTKRPENIINMLRLDWLLRPRPHVWLGASVGVRASLPRVAALRAVPAAVRFLSCEPLLEDLGPLSLYAMDWVIIGGESGPGAREMPALGYGKLMAHCRQDGVPVFFKQTGEVLARKLNLKDRAGADIAELPVAFQVREFPRTSAVCKTVSP